MLNARQKYKVLENLALLLRNLIYVVDKNHEVMWLHLQSHVIMCVVTSPWISLITMTTVEDTLRSQDETLSVVSASILPSYQLLRHCLAGCGFLPVSLWCQVAQTGTGINIKVLVPCRYEWGTQVSTLHRDMSGPQVLSPHWACGFNGLYLCGRTGYICRQV